MDSRAWIQILSLAESRLDLLIDIENRGRTAAAELFDEGYTLEEMDKELDKLYKESLKVITSSCLPLAKLRDGVRKLKTKILEHDEALHILAKRNRVGPCQDDPRNFIEVKIPFPVYAVWR